MHENVAALKNITLHFPNKKKRQKVGKIISVNFYGRINQNNLKFESRR